MGENDADLADVSQHFNQDTPDQRVFANAGVMVNGVFYTCKVEAQYDGHRTTLGEIVAQTPREYITENFYIPDADVPNWEKEKGGKTWRMAYRRPGDSREKRSAVVVWPGEPLAEPVWVDLLTGEVRAVPKENATACADGTVFTGVPVYDSPCIITERRAIDIDEITQ